MKSIMLLFMVAISWHSSLAQKSGLAVGKNCPAFDPYHASGPDRGTRTCPMCKYGQQQGIMVWVNNSNWEEIERIARRLEAEIDLRGILKMRAFIIYMNPDHEPMDKVLKSLTDLANRAGLDQVALTCIPSAADPKSAKLFEINPDPKVRNTVFVYKKRRVFEKFINLDVQRDLDKLVQSFDRTL